MTRQPLTAAMVLSLLAACGPSEVPTPDDSADRAAIEAIFQAENRAVESGDFSAFLPQVHPDGTVMPADAPAVTGAAGYRAFAEEFSAAATVKFNEIRPGELIVSGDLAVYPYAASWVVTPRDGSPPISEDVKGIHVFRRGADGAWRLSHDIWNANAP